MADNAISLDRRSLVDRMRNFSSSRYTLIGAFLWGLCEGTFFFIVPDVLTTLVALFRLRAGLMTMAASIVGSLLSGVAMYLLVASLGELTMVHFVGSVPFISDQMIRNVSQQMSQFGVAALVVAPLQGYPYKIYSLEASIQGLSIEPFLLWSILSRLERLLPITLFAGVLGIIFRKSIQNRTRMWLAIYLTIWLVVYVFYWVILPGFE